jgi:hypothetical protein
LLKKSFITGITILQPLYLLYIYAILIPNWGKIESCGIPLLETTEESEAVGLWGAYREIFEEKSE